MTSGIVKGAICLAESSEPRDSTSEAQESLPDTFYGLTPVVDRCEHGLQSSETDPEKNRELNNGARNVPGDIQVEETIKEHNDSGSRVLCGISILHNDVDEEEDAGSQPQNLCSSDLISFSSDNDQLSSQMVFDGRVSERETNQEVRHAPLCGLATLNNQDEVMMNQSHESIKAHAQMPSQEELSGEIEKFSSFSKRNVPQDRKHNMKRLQEDRRQASFRTAALFSHSGITEYIGNGDRTQITSKSAFSRALLEKNEEENLIRLLSIRSAHLPGLNWYQDWLQFIKNNHPLFGLCFHHALHPLQLRHRIYIFIASISFGLLATNSVYLYYMLSAENFDEKIFRIFVQVQDGTFQPLEITKGMAALWVYNGIAHALFDLSLWHISACNCFNKRENFARLQTVGKFFVVAVAGIMAALSSCFILYRAMIASSLAAAAMNDDEGEDEDLLGGIFKLEGYAFLIGYFAELLAVYCVVHPTLVTIMFSGALGCIPGLGGRPKDVVRELNRILDQRERMFDNFEIV